MLKKEIGKFYKVKDGQSLREIAVFFSVSAFALATENGLTGEPYCGQVLKIPKERGNVYTVREGDTEELICGSKEAYGRKNGTDILYPGMRVIL